jgi:[acyl-carrier-protein] S-malonyltransferase
MKIAALFPGYGSHFVGAMKGLYDQSRLIQEHFEQASDCIGVNFVKLCFASSEVELSRMSNAYLTLFLASSSLFDLLKQEGVEVDCVAGHTIGQYAAMYAAGSLSLPDGLYIINKFVKMYQDILDAGEYSFARIFDITSPELEKLCKKASSKKAKVTVAIYEGATEHVIAGSAPLVDAVCKQVIDREGVVEFVGAESGLHSSLMEPALIPFKMYLEKVDFKDAALPVLCSADGNALRVGTDLKACTVASITQPVLWNKVMDHVINYDLLIQIGPGTVLHDMIKQLYPVKKILTLTSRADIEKIKALIQAH